MARRRTAASLVQRANAQVQSIPAPVGGWNARDSLADMDPADAVTMVNMFPTASNVVLRGGYINWATGMSGQVETLMTYNQGNSIFMYAIDATGKCVYDVTSEGAVGAAKVTGLSNARWEWVNVTNSAGTHFLYAVNGIDKPILYDGTTWTRVDAASTPAITGVTTTSLVNITLFKNRIWFIEKNTLRAWFLPTQAVGGAASLWDLSSVAQKGGHLVDIATWTIDAGYGVDDNLVFVTSVGEVIVYAGTDPSSASTFALIGVWQLGAPIGRRCMEKYGGDILILTYDGLLPLAAALQSSRLDPRVAITDKIQGAISAATTAYAGNREAFGWQICYYAKANALMLNVPVSVGQQQQYVMNTITKSWCNFQGWPANCWTITNDTPYFGGNGVVCQAWDGSYSDNATDIATNTLQAFNYMGQRGVEKYFTRARPSIFTSGTPGIFIGLNTDYQISDTSQPLSFTPNNAALWDVGLWDSAVWGDSLTITNNWQGVTGVGYCAAIQFKTASMGLQIQWAATDLVFQGGWAGI